MSDTKYKVIENEGDHQIIRLADNKIMANVEDGEIKPTAAVYSKKSIFQGLEDAWDEYYNESFLEMAEQVQTVAGIDEEVFIDLVQVENSEVERVVDDLEDHIKAILEVEGAAGVAAYIRLLLGEQDSTQDTIDYTDAPPCNPSLGDRTPEFMAWLKDNHPSEAIKRYGKI